MYPKTARSIVIISWGVNGQQACLLLFFRVRQSNGRE